MTGGRVVVLGPTGRNFAAGMSGGIAYVFDPETQFEAKCNKEMVELLKVETNEDEKFLKDLLLEFVAKTESRHALAILDNWDECKTQFVKVFPYEYQRALKELEAEAEQKANGHTNGTTNGSTNGHTNGNTNGDVKSPEVKKAKAMNGSAVNGHKVADIEDSVKDGEMAKKKKEVLLDKTRGFVKYKRETKMYRDAAERQKDWEEIYDFKHVRRGLKVQAARCMDCGVPFCHSTSHGCPLGNIIPKWNDLVFKDNWEEAAKQLLQTNNFPEFTGRVCPAPCEGACVLGRV